MLKIISSITLVAAISAVPTLALAKSTNFSSQPQNIESEYVSNERRIALSGLNVAPLAKVSRSYQKAAIAQMNRHCRSRNADCRYLLHVPHQNSVLSYYVKDQEAQNQGHHLCSFRAEDVNKDKPHHYCISYGDDGTPFGYDEIEAFMRSIISKQENIEVFYYFPNSDGVVFVGRRNGKINLYYITNRTLREHFN
jgi:hypothetical protein